MGAGGVAVGLARQHAGQLDHPLVVVEQAGPGHGGGVVALLGHPHLGVGVGRHLGQVGDDQHLVPVGQAGQRAAHGERGGAADAGVDLVEDQGGGAHR